MQNLETTERDALTRIDAALDEAAIEAIRVELLGKKGSISELLKSLGSLSPDERKTFGAQVNAMRDRVSARLADRKAQLGDMAMEARLASERVDVTLSPRPELSGRIHPVSQILDEAIAIFADMGFSIAEGPDIELDDYNFTRLNIPPEHPARQMHDTFYLKPKTDGSRQLLRTQTTPLHVRTMLAQKPPIRIIVPGRVYRMDSDQTHTPMFHQIEGLVIDESAHMGHLKWILEEFCRALFEVPKVEMRLRPSHFPFTEPSAEVDIRCDRSGAEIKLGQGNDWLEILGCGMVHPKVIEMCGHDPAKYQGFAWGMGLDRLAMLKYGAPDLRAFFDADIRWLKHYGFAALDVPSLAGGLSR
ncbi:MAG: phenylalanine--tRNA ligase subunit alpha [Alphaproteobacteria bacterium]